METGIKNISDNVENVTRQNRIGLSLEKGVCGLINLHNSCFMNCVLQCMFKTVELAKYFISNDYKKNLNRKSNTNGRLAHCFAVLLKGFWSGQCSYLEPIDFRDCFKELSVGENLMNGDPQCAKEFCECFLNDGLHNHLNTEFDGRGENITSEIQRIFQLVTNKPCPDDTVNSNMFVFLELDETKKKQINFLT